MGFLLRRTALTRLTHLARALAVARPRRKHGTVRSEQLNIRLTPARMAAVRAAAKAHELAPVAWARLVLVTATIAETKIRTRDPALVEEAALHRRELIRVGNLLNQAVRRLHSEGEPPTNLGRLVQRVAKLVEKQIAKTLASAAAAEEP